MESPFEVLGVDPDADEATVESAYREKVKETHPDLGGSLRAFLRVRAAYEAIQRGDGSWAGGTGGAGDGHGSADGHEGGPDDGADDGPTPARVEYLDYEALADHGWSLGDEDLFEKAAAAGLDPAEHGRILVEPGESLLEAAENRGFAWPYACRGGACANCAVAVRDGELSMPVNHILPSEMVDEGVRLSCVGSPTTDEMRVVFNLKHLPDLDELRLPPHPFEQAYRGD